MRSAVHPLFATVGRYTWFLSLLGSFPVTIDGKDGQVRFSKLAWVKVYEERNDDGTLDCLA